MKNFEFWLEKSFLLWRHFLFFLSREISYPLVAPDMLQLCFMFRCNLKCRMCRIQEKYEGLKKPGEDYELSFDVIKSLITQASGMGIKQLFLLGGEPFLREDLFDIIRFAQGLKMRTLVYTNGTLLDNEEIIVKILDSRLDDLVVSIDGSCENIYSMIRAKGMIEKIKNNIKLLNKIKKDRKSSLPKMGVFCTIMDQNIDDLIDIVHLARELEASFIGFQAVVVDNTDSSLRVVSDPNGVPESRYSRLDDSVDKLLAYKLSSEVNSKFIFTSRERLKMIKQYFRGGLPRQKCYMGFNRIIISQDGKMYFCAQEPDQGDISFGDVRKESLRDLWYSHKARIFRRSIKRCSKSCLLGCSRRDELDRLIDDLSYDFHCGNKRARAY